jgi:NAD(P)-dependent dehydrogenase (short-subunit alcohol dehydrogenase family)
MRMQGKVALITGAGSGIGRATALRFAVEGARVVCVDANLEAAQETARAIDTRDSASIALAGDVTSEPDCAGMVAQALSRFGALTTLVNCAGVRPQRPGPSPSTSEWQQVIEVNLTGSYLPARAAIPALAESGAGAIVNLGSIYGLVGGSTGPAYAASKGAIVNLTRQMALEWAPEVRVNCVCPGVIETPMTAALRADPAWAQAALKRYPLARFGQPEEIASAILFLASDEAAFVTGVALPVDGGFTAG